MNDKKLDKEFEAIMNGINREYWRDRLWKGDFWSRVYALLRWLETF